MYDWESDAQVCLGLSRFCLGRVEVTTIAGKLSEYDLYETQI